MLETYEIARDFSTEDGRHDDFLDAVSDRIRQLTEMVSQGYTSESLNPVVGGEPTDPTEGGPGTDVRYVVNNGVVPISGGRLVGRNSSEVTVLALAASGASYIRAQFASVETTGPGESFQIALVGTIDLKIEAGQVPSIGDGMFLSDTEAGTVRPGAPMTAGSRGQFVGVCQEAMSAETGKALVVMALVIQAGR